MEEIWKDIPGYEGIYQVSNLGNVKNSKNKIMSKWLGSNGYYTQTLYNNKKRKNYENHKLVAMGFLNHLPCGFKIVVDHIDNNPLNNNLNNLQLISNRKNTSKDRKNKTSKYVGVCWSKKSKKWQANISIDGVKIQIGTFETAEKAHDAYKKELKNFELH